MDGFRDAKEAAYALKEMTGTESLVKVVGILEKLYIVGKGLSYLSSFFSAISNISYGSDENEDSD